MEFNQSVITTRGRQLMAKLLAGKKMNFSKIALSSTEYPQGQLESLTALTNIKQMTTVQAYANNSQTVSAVGAIENTGLTEGYFINTVGLYAIDPDLGEILYSVATAKQNGYIPPDTGVSKSGVQIKVYTEVANALQVDLTVDPAAYATQEDIDRFKAAGIQEAWANSSDGVTDFTNVKPNENLMSAKGNVEDDSKNGFIIMNGNISAQQLGVTSNFSKLKGSEEKQYTLSVYYISGDAFETDGITYKNSFGVFTISGNVTTNVNWSRPSNTYKKWDLIGRKTFTLKLDEKNWLQWWTKGSTIYNDLTIAVKLEVGGTNTKYLASDSVSAINSLMQYKGIGIKDSTNPSDYRWSESDEYRDYKEDKLTQAIIALGGTV